MSEARARTWGDMVRLARWLAGFVRPHWKLLALTVLCTAAYAQANAGRVWLVREFAGIFEELEKPGAAASHWDRVSFLALVAAGIALSFAAAEFGKEYLGNAFVLRVHIAIREAVARHVLSLSMRFFHRSRLGDVFSRLTNDVAMTQSALVFLFTEIFADAIAIVWLAGACVWASPLLSLSAIAVGPLVVLPLVALGRKIRRRAHGRQLSQADLTESMQQMFTGIRIVKAFDAEAKEAERFHLRNEDYFRKSLKVVRAKAISKGLLDLINNALVPVLLLAGMWVVIRGALPPRDLVAFMVALGLMYEPAKKLVKSYTGFQESLAGADRVQELLAERSDVPDAPDSRPLEVRHGAVTFERVSFAYAGETVLKDVSLEARAGEVVAVVGPSGAGKSTLLDLIARFYDPQEGTVRIDGQDIRKVTRASLMRHLAIVTQEPFLFNDTVLENVRYGRPEATEEEVIEACRAADIHDVIVALPAGYRTIVGERGATLSGGERQRLTIARAILKDPTILLLDEATSALDSESEKAVQAALERLMKGRTTFVVAHRLSTITAADRIVVIDRGRIVEQGRHEELVRRGGLYAKLWALQSGGSLGAVPLAGQAGVPEAETAGVESAVAHGAPRVL